MDNEHDKTKMKVEGDRLSNLPDDLILKIFSLIGTKRAIKTSVLSSRWRYLWTSMTCLNFSNREFRTLVKFSKYVTHVLSNRNNQVEVSAVRLTMVGSRISEAFSKRILNKVLKYAFSHNVQELSITCQPGIRIESPLSPTCSKSLKHLTLIGFVYECSTTTPSTWELPALETLNLYNVTLYGDNADKSSSGLFSNCVNLKNLTIKDCEMKGFKNINISHPGLSNLTLENCDDRGDVVTPKLKNLTIRNCQGVHLIFAPNLASLHYESFCDPLKLSAELLHLEKLDICIKQPFNYKIDARKIVCLLQQLHSVRILTLNLELVKLLSSRVELISHQPSPFTNLKSLKIYPNNVIQEGKTPPEVTIPTEIKNYLLDGSPGAALTLVSYEEIRDMKNVASAENLMRELQGLLEYWRTHSVTNATHVEQGEAEAPMEVENHQAQAVSERKWPYGKRNAHIVSYWDGLNRQLKEGRVKAVRTVSMLESIEGELTKLPTSHRDKLQERFSDMLAEADRIMHNVMDDLKIQCDKQPMFQSLFS